MQEQRIIWVKDNLCDKKIYVKDIIYLEAQNQNVSIVTTKETYSVRYNISDFEKELKEDNFFRIHRGYLISLAAVKSVGKNELTLSDNTVLPVSRTKEKGLKEALFQYVRKESI